MTDKFTEMLEDSSFQQQIGVDQMETLCVSFIKFPVNVHLHQFGEWLSDILGCGWFLSGSTKDGASMFEDLDYNHLYA